MIKLEYLLLKQKLSSLFNYPKVAFTVEHKQKTISDTKPKYMNGLCKTRRFSITSILSIAVIFYLTLPFSF